MYDNKQKNRVKLIGAARGCTFRLLGPTWFIRHPLFFNLQLSTCFIAKYISRVRHSNYVLTFSHIHEFVAKKMNKHAILSNHMYIPRRSSICLIKRRKTEVK